MFRAYRLFVFYFTSTIVIGMLRTIATKIEPLVMALVQQIVELYDKDRGAVNYFGSPR